MSRLKQNLFGRIFVRTNLLFKSTHVSLPKVRQIIRRQTYRLTDGQTMGWMDGQMEKWTDVQMDRGTDQCVDALD